jgi:hypothetical protein
MTSKEYVIWLKGFVEACHEYAPTPKQWDALKDKLAEVADEENAGTPIGPGWGVPNSAPIVTLPYITPGPSTDPFNPYKITCESGGTLPISGSISIANPYVLSFTTGSGTYNPSTTTLWNPSGSLWSYTSTLPQQPKVESNQLELDFEPK